MRRGPSTYAGDDAPHKRVLYSYEYVRDVVEIQYRRSDILSFQMMKLL